MKTTPFQREVVSFGSKHFFIICLTCHGKVVDKKEEKKSLIIAHRGASGYLPEHTLPSKAMGNHVYSLSSLSFVDIVVLFLAFGYDVDYIEQDVALMKDDVPLIIHDIYLDEVTDVKQIYPDRHRPDGRYYVIDFTFQEVKALNVSERFNHITGLPVFPKRFSLDKGKFSLASLSEEIEMIQGMNFAAKKFDWHLHRNKRTVVSSPVE
ncbi:unnamed protein product [Didymodactylos carnosus]|uniref:GP-PDE domain-containing protein n=1 Tax=Didymodactylos carnosus TaxID=1234261 RepID=A0A813NJT4_9BILA|nr:unnamed protein product [Didymodactylos carnosus]CAF3519049.1 unnamed protein product [Didymodactylos carnosus]